jgi:hydrogenase nickel incorporation protein HypA/HybF
MHELSLAISLLDIIEEYARQYEFRRVKTLHLSLGRLSCCEPKSLTFAFDIQARGTKAEGATLRFDIRPVIVYCFACQQEWPLDGTELICPHCRGGDVILSGGTEELKLLEIDVDEENE